MRGKVGLVIGLGIGYVLGTRAGRERYEQIKEQALKVWNLDAVQSQVEKAKDLAKTTVSAIPGKLVDGAVKLVNSATGEGSGSEPEKKPAKTTARKTTSGASAKSSGGKRS